MNFEDRHPVRVSQLLPSVHLLGHRLAQVAATPPVIDVIAEGIETEEAGQRRGSPCRRSASCAGSPATAASWCTPAPDASRLGRIQRHPPSSADSSPSLDSPSKPKHHIAARPRPSASVTQDVP